MNIKILCKVFLERESLWVLVSLNKNKSGEGAPM